MPSPLLADSPSRILREILITLGVGVTVVSTDSPDWSVYVSAEPSLPDNCITLYDSAGEDGGRNQIDGTRKEKYGVQIRVRATDHNTGWERARLIGEQLDTLTVPRTVVVGANQYTVYNVSRATSIIPMGFEPGVSRRKLFSLNVVMTITT